MTPSTTSSRLAMSTSDRVERLLGFLASDPDNTSIRAEIFETAMQLADFVLAKAQIEAVRASAQSLQPEWLMREANLEIALSHFNQAQALLMSMQNTVGHHPAISQNLGFLALLRGEPETCIQLLTEWAEVAVSSPVPPGMQALWLRALHHSAQVDRALGWARQRQASGNLQAEAQGVASLLALDAHDLSLAKSWSEQALTTLPLLQEALLTRATLLLAEQDRASAQQIAQDVLSRDPKCGRAWSILGLTQMLALNLNTARESLEQAVHWMPAHIGTWHSLAWACFLAKDYTAAQKAFNAALERNHNFAETHGGLAVIAAATGQQTAAEEHLRRAFGLDEECMTAQYARAMLDGTLNDEQAVHALARQIIRQSGKPR